MNDMQYSDKPTVLALLPLKNVVILPRSIVPIMVGRTSSIQAVEYSLKKNKTLFITSQKDSEVENPTEKDVFTHGTRSTILQVTRMPKGTLKVIVEGICRAKMLNVTDSTNFISVECKDTQDDFVEQNDLEIEVLWRKIKTSYSNYAHQNSKIPPADLLENSKSIDEITKWIDTLSVHCNLSFNERQYMLETSSLKDRMVKLLAVISRELEILETEERIKGRVQTQVEKSQREYYLTEQIKAIQKELGREDNFNEVTQIRNKIKTLGLSPDAADKVERELKKLEQMPPLSSEAVISRNYVDWIISLPWKKVTKDTISLEQAEKILDQNHAGLKKVKERIIEFLAAKKFSESFQRSPIICLVGPPGVGKTSLAKSIADSLEREFVRISLGGIKDEAEIRGHRRTYIGAMPGKIIQAMRKSHSLNTVILLDEIDKISSDYHGDPASALLEVLDPEQNKSFVDHYIEAEYDLSKVMFIATANHIDGIPYPLFDRMEIIKLSGYTDNEKEDIAKSFLITKNLKEYGLKVRQFKLPDEILKKIISGYTKEAGVRQLERVIAKLMRKSIQILLKDSKVKSVTINEKLLKEWLGNIKYKKISLDTGQRIGLATGLAWTEVGGDVLEIEITILPGKGVLTLTGQLGEVMQESAHAALSYIRSRTDVLGLKNDFYANTDIHMHIPEGATPKDGPSAGITICTALVSALTKNPTKSDVAMTGEITLRGRVLPVGGLKEKILAASQHGIKTVLISQENKDDIDDLLKEEKFDENYSQINISFVSDMDQVLKQALVNDPFNIKSKTKSKTKTKTKKTKSTKTKKD